MCLRAFPATLAHARSARVRGDEACGGEDACFTARTRAPASSGKVTMEISHKSTANRLRTRVLRVDAAAHGAEADRQPVDGARLQQRQQFACARDFGDQPAARIKPARVLAQFQPDADRLGRVVLEQHGDAVDPAQAQRLGKGAAHHLVARLVDLAEQAGVAFHRAVGVDGGARREHGRDGGFGLGCEHGSSFTSPRLRGEVDVRAKARTSGEGLFLNGSETPPHPARSLRCSPPSQPKSDVSDFGRN